MTGTIPDPIRPQESRHRQCRSRLFSRDFVDPYPPSAIESPKSMNQHIQCEPTEDQGGFTRYARFTSSDATDGSSNRDYLLHDSMESYVTDDVRSLLQRLRRSYKAIYGRVQDSGAAIADRASAVKGKYNNARIF